jgi:multisubunit Na+/H+ antiporter MnhG subunit
MTAVVVDIVLLCGVILLCWLGVLGMWRMKGAHAGLALSLAASYCRRDSASDRGAGLARLRTAFWKTLLIAAILIATNSVVTHATARAFRARELGHWEPIDDDPMEMVHEEKKP